MATAIAKTNLTQTYPSVDFGRRLTRRGIRR